MRILQRERWQKEGLLYFVLLILSVLFLVGCGDKTTDKNPSISQDKVGVDESDLGSGKNSVEVAPVDVLEENSEEASDEEGDSESEEINQPSTDEVTSAEEVSDAVSAILDNIETKTEEDPEEASEEEVSSGEQVTGEVANTEVMTFPTTFIMNPAIPSQSLQYDTIKAVWVSYLELEPILRSGSKDAYLEWAQDVVKNSKALGLNTIMYQVRPFADALYVSAIFPSSYIAGQPEGSPLAFDPLGEMIEIAHQEGIRVEAWINPYRIRTAGSKVPISKDSIVYKWQRMKDERLVLTTKEGIVFFNPAKEPVRNLIVAGVKELVYGYDIDGVHFDDYFYPTTDSAIDDVEYLSYFYNNDTLTRPEWRREQVNSLIKEVYNAVKEVNRNLVFGISPMGDLASNYDQQFIDVGLWVSQPGYVDYIAPQIYFGYEHPKVPYLETLKEWDQLITNNVTLIPGLAAYKVGLEDKWAGEGKNEWKETEGILNQMIQDAKETSHYGGYALFRYDFLFAPEQELVDRMARERKALSGK